MNALCTRRTRAHIRGAMPRRLSIAALAFPFLVGAASLPCQEPPTHGERVDSIFAAWDHADSPGAAVGVVRDGRLVLARGYGSADLEHGISITPHTRFHAASEAKQFTAVTVLILVERNVLDLDDNVRKWLPEVPDFGTPITIRHLLNHSSGLRDQWQALALAGRHGDDAITTADVLRMVERQRSLNFEPGTMELYCNTGFTLLAEIVARASGRSFADFARQEIFEPLGMKSTLFYDDLHTLVPERAESYSRDSETGEIERRVLNYAVPGATSLLTTVEDMAKWLSELAAPTLRSPAFYAPLYDRDTLNDGTEVIWGYGMIVEEHRGHIRVGHGGGDAGFRAYSVRFPEHDLGVIVLSNLAQMNPGPFGDALALRVADLFLPPDREPDVAAEPDDAPDLDLDRFVGSYRLPDDSVLTVTNEFGTLVLRFSPTGREIVLRPEDGASFLAGAPSLDRVSFATDGTAAAWLRLESQAGATTAERVDALPAGGAGAYAGVYYSDELGTTWTLEKREGGLVARHLMYRDVTLQPVVRDLFEGDAWFFGEVRFTRDPAGLVDGFMLNAGRIKKVRFTRR